MKSQPASAHGAVLLLVDDNPHGLIARRTVLEELGYVVYTSSSDDEALELFTANKVDLLITDFRMPNMDGVELIARIKQLRTDFPVILLSEFVEPLGLTEKSTGADVVLSKSAGEVGLLVRSVRRLLNRQPRRPRRPPKTSRAGAALRLDSKLADAVATPRRAEQKEKPRGRSRHPQNPPTVDGFGAPFRPEPQERNQIEEVIVSLELLALSPERRRGRPPAIKPPGDPDEGSGAREFS